MDKDIGKHEGSAEDEMDMSVEEKNIITQQSKISEAERKAIIREARKKAFEKYDDVFKKLSKN